MLNNTKEVVEKLRKEAQSNKAFNAVCHVFALRQRARREIYISSLMQKMEKEGFKFNKEEYIKVLQFLSSIGLGKLHMDHKGRVLGLRDIHTTLQSIGNTVCSNGVLKSLKMRNKFKSIESTPVTPTQVKYALSEVKIQFPIRGKSVTVSIPKDMTSEEIAGLIETLKDTQMQ